MVADFTGEQRAKVYQRKA